ncbi:ethanolamine ammonia-lyase subunit EutC [Streptomyces sp. NPDC050560]|uniref:ethanolamine ammonia-lyase subunit EutC n=1 Tax=Streptomyces sp. NPDC050560 TaxID=3365630 RepID=UPI0037BC5151
MSGASGASGGGFWEPLRRATPARIGLGRAGNGVPTRAVLEADAAHALARDAVHLPLDAEALLAAAAEVAAGRGLPAPVRVASAAPDRATYLTRPDLGRRLAEDTVLPAPDGPVDLMVVLADGLSATAVHRHALAVLRQLLAALPAGTTVGPPVIATQARVALGDHVARALGARMVLVLLGERPGLSSADSLGAYLTWSPRPPVPDSARNCVSNIRPPHGLGHAAAARTLAALMAGAREIGATGVRLKATGGELPG